MPSLDTSLTYCTYCPKLCRHTCPVSHAEAKETLVPQAKMATMRLIRLGQAPRDVETTASLYGCTGCGACTEFCRHDIEVDRALFTGRDEAERDGRGHPALAGFVDRFVADAEAAADATRACVPEERRSREGAVAFFVGCEAPTLARTALDLFDRIRPPGAAPVDAVVPERACGGYPLLAAGQHDAFRLHAERLAAELQRFERVVVHCPACAFVMRSEYPKFGAPLTAKIEHTSEYLDAFADQLPVTRRREAAFYHDPCYLGRHLGVYDPPRRLASRAVERLHEFSRARGESECCGGGGLLPITMPETADAISDHRLDEVKEAGLRTLVTACPTCKQRLGRGGVEAIDLVELLEQATRP